MPAGNVGVILPSNQPTAMQCNSLQHTSWSGWSAVHVLMWWITIPRNPEVQILNHTNFSWNLIWTGDIKTNFLVIDFFMWSKFAATLYIWRGVYAKTNFLGMLPPELSLTTKPTESQFGDLGEIHRNRGCVIRQKVLVQCFGQKRRLRRMSHQRL